MPPKKKIPNLGPLPAREKEKEKKKHTAKRSIAEHFSRLPRRHVEVELDEFASHGASLIQKQALIAKYGRNIYRCSFVSGLFQV